MGLAVFSSSAMATAGYTLLPVPPPAKATRRVSLLELDEWHEIETLLDSGVLWNTGKEKERVVAININACACSSSTLISGSYYELLGKFQPPAKENKFLLKKRLFIQYVCNSLLENKLNEINEINYTSPFEG